MKGCQQFCIYDRESQPRPRRAPIQQVQENRLHLELVTLVTAVVSGGMDLLG